MQQFEDFNENDPKYQCCCGCCHVATGVKLLLALYIFGSILQMFTAGSAVLAVIPFGYLVIVAPCTIYALNNEKHAYLWVFIIATIISVVACCVLLLLISYLFFSNNWEAFEDKIGEEKETDLAIYVIAMFVQLAYGSLVLRVLFDCKRYIADKCKAKIMYSWDAAPRPNAVLPTSGQVEPPPYAHNCKFYCCLVQNAGYQQLSASSELQQQPAPGHYGVGWGYQQVTSAPQQSPSPLSNALGAKIRPLSRGMAASPNRWGVGNNGGSSPITAQNERRKREEALMDQLRVTFPNINQDVLCNYMNEYRNQLPNHSLKGLSVEVALEGVVSLIVNNTACRDSLLGANVIQLRCHHRFHADCIKDWLMSQQTCPSCGTYSPSLEEYPELS